jgi:uncharacterized protein YyaL (SSP411 family)
MALTTLVRMAQGGMYDQLGGGFARYSVDRYWLVPHFEKMLYDNAQLVRAYLHAYQLSGEPFFRRVAEETLAYLQREMLDPSGGFYSAQDADSEGIEGKFFVWTPAEVTDLLGPDDGALACEWFGITDRGNFQDPHHPEFGRRNVLTTWEQPESVAEKLGVPTEELGARVEAIRGRMFAAREQRVRPGLDDKSLASWNGLALAAFAEAGRVLGNRHYVDTARRNATFLRNQLWRDGRLLHTCKDGTAKVDGMLEDYAYVGLGLVELFKATGEIAHLEWARQLLEVIVERFRDDDGLFFETPHDAENLLVRQKAFFDSATPGGSSAAALLAFWMGRYYGRDDWTTTAEHVVASQREFLLRAPTGFGTLWQVAELLLAPRQEAVIVGEPDAREPFERVVAAEFRPWLVLAPTQRAEGLPLFEGRAPEPLGARAYLCENMVCQLPADDVEVFAGQIAAR